MQNDQWPGTHGHHHDIVDNNHHNQKYHIAKFIRNNETKYIIA